MVRSQYIRIKNPLHKHFAGMPMVGGVGVKNRENLPTSLMDSPKGYLIVNCINDKYEVDFEFCLLFKLRTLV